MGDQIDPHTGALVFNVTDVELPGNSGLEVAIRRTATTAEVAKSSAEPEDREQTFLADWELDLPYVQNLMEKPNVFGATGRTICSDGYHDDSAGFSEGFAINIPGQGTQTLLEPHELYMWRSNSSPHRADYVTLSHWRISCLTDSDGFLATSPNGVQYIMDRYAEVPALGYDTMSPDENRSTRPGGIATRVKATWYATTVRNVSGAFVLYDYNLDRLTRISSSDGRQITLTYHPGTRNIASVQANGRTWTYSYRNVVSPDGTLRWRVLDRVTQPDGTYWKYDIEWFTAIDGLDSVVTGANATVKHPYGATAEYELRTRRHAFKWVDHPHPHPLLVSVVATVADANHAVIRKTLSGAGLPTSVWSYDYQPADTPEGFESEDQTRWVRETRPDGSVLERHTYKYGLLRGKARTQYIKEDTSESAAVLEEKNFTYTVGPRLGHIEVLTGGDALDRTVTPVYVQQESTTRPNGGSGTAADTSEVNFRYNNDSASSLYSYGNAIRKYTQSGGSGKTYNYAYTYRKAHWILGLLSSVTFGGTEVERHSYDALGRRESSIHHGVERFRYGYHSTAGQRGAIAWLRDALDRTTSFDDYKRGIPQRITQPNRVTRSRSVDDNGWLESVTNGRGFTTEYEYNDMGWVRRVVRPERFSDITIDYTDIGTAARQTIVEGSKETYLEYDALHRELLERVRPLRDGGETTYRQRSFDTMGRLDRRFFPSFLAGSQAATVHSYDALGRFLSARDTVTPFAERRIGYIPSQKVRMFDPLGNRTTYTFDGLDGVPGEGGLTHITDPQYTRTTITRDRYYRVSAVQKVGSHNGHSVSATQSLFYDEQFRLCRHHTSEAGSTLYAYDDVGNVTTEVRGAPAGTGCAFTNLRRGRTTFEYDAVDLPVEVVHWGSDGQPEARTEYVYDSNQNVEWVSHEGPNEGDYQAVDLHYGYNELDRLTSEDVSRIGFPDVNTPGPWPGVTFDIAEYAYDDDGRLEQITTPKGREIDYALNGLGQVISVSATDRQVSATIASADEITYHANGALNRIRYGNGLRAAYLLDSRQMLDRIIVDAGRVVDLDYIRDAAGRIITADDHRSPSQNRSYAYDAAGRLESASGPWGNGVFEYDALDNLRSKALGAQFQVNVEYNDQNQVRRVLHQDASEWTNYVHDARGNVTNNGRLAIGYGDSYRLPTSMRSVNGGGVDILYFYDGHGRRVFQEDRSGSAPEYTTSFYSKTGTLLYREKLNTEDYEESEYTEYIRVAGQTIARIKRGAVASEERVEYVHNNHLGSPVAATSASGLEAWQESYTPFGEKLNNVSENRDDVGFATHVQDASTGLSYMQARYYDPQIGRFLSTDPVNVLGHLARRRTEGFNAYAYGYNDPVNNIDPDGRLVETLWDLANIVMGVGSLGSNLANGEFVAAAVDLGGLAVDIAAAAVPVVPGGAGTAIKASRAGKAAVDAVQGGAAAAAKGGGKLCFAAGTVVQTADGAKPIEKIEIGDLVWARDDKTGEEGWKPVVQLFVTPTAELLELTFEGVDGVLEVLRVTAEHPLWSLDDGTWDTAGHLDLEEYVDALSEPLRLVAVEQEAFAETVYNFEVADSHTYFVGESGIWAHNSCGGGAKAGAKAGQLKKLGKSQLKGLDEHAMKQAEVGQKQISKYNISKTKDGEVVLTPVKKGSRPNVETGKTLKELKDDFPEQTR